MEGGRAEKEPATWPAFEGPLLRPVVVTPEQTALIASLPQLLEGLQRCVRSPRLGIPNPQGGPPHNNASDRAADCMPGTLAAKRNPRTKVWIRRAFSRSICRQSVPQGTGWGGVGEQSLGNLKRPEIEEILDKELLNPG